jgi:hypothetical protein
MSGISTEESVPITGRLQTVAGEPRCTKGEDETDDDRDQYMAKKRSVEAETEEVK